METTENMGLIHADMELIRGADLVLWQEGYLAQDKIKKIKVKMLVDTGAYMLAINENIRSQLDLKTVDQQVAELADGTKVKLDLVGPVEVRFANRRTSVDAMVLPGDAEPLLGAIPLEGLDVVLDPANQTIKVNPDSPNYAKKPLKRMHLTNT